MNATKHHRTATSAGPLSPAPRPAPLESGALESGALESGALESAGLDSAALRAAGPREAGPAGLLALGLLAASGTAFFALAATGLVTRLAGGGAVDAGLPMAVALLVTSLAFGWARRTSPVARFHGRAFRYLLDAQVLVLLTALSGPHPGIMATVAVAFVVLRLLATSALTPTTTARRA